MGSYRKRGASWQAEVYRNGKRETATFPSKVQAVRWVNQREAELTGARLPDKSVGDALTRYAEEESPKHRGERWEALRLALIGRDPLASMRLPPLRPTHIAEWRERRLRGSEDRKPVGPGAVRREMNLLQSVFKVARLEWGWLSIDPMEGISRPVAPASRKRRIPKDEVDRLSMALGYVGGPPESVSHRVALAFLFALETAMRAGEILGLHWADVGAKSVNLPLTKNGDARKVPLSPRAREILALLPRTDPVFGLLPAQRDALFRKARDRAQIPNLHFHDSRAEAIWRLSKVFDVMELARVIGHRDLKSLLLYYQTDADDLADRLG